MKKVFLAAAVLYLFTSNLIFSQSSRSVLQETGATALKQGFDAYHKGDWTSSVIFLRKAVAYPGFLTEENLYILIMSEINAGELKSAQADCDLFLSSYEYSLYSPVIKFHKGRILHSIGENENAIMVLSDFCHQNTDHELYPSALYWIAESFYSEYDFESARALYSRIVNDFPGDSKNLDSRYRIEMIDQRQREEKLLYLLKVTGEENLSSKEEYERQLRQYQTEDKMGLRRQLSDAQKRIAELEQQVTELRIANSNIMLKAKTVSVPVFEEETAPAEVVQVDNNTEEVTDIPDTEVINETENKEEEPGSDSEVDALKLKAKQLQFILEEQIAGE